ncbi:MAG: hypothetical protein IJX77_08890 [Ruminococcus sp.]|nr:hypothetical protein [Ruminococcus sp.]
MFNKDENNGDYIRPSEEYRADCEDYHEHGQTYDDYNDEQRPYDAYNALENEFSPMLTSGEHILWAGRSAKNFSFSAASIPVLIFMIFWLGFTAFWTVSVVSMGAGFMGVFAIPFFAVGIFMFIKLLRPGKKKYAITNMRVIRAEGRRVTSDRLGSICNITITRSGSTGNVTYNIMGTAFYTSQTRMAQSNTGIIGVERPEEVYRILNSAVAGSVMINKGE